MFYKTIIICALVAVTTCAPPQRASNEQDPIVASLQSEVKANGTILVVNNSTETDDADFVKGLFEELKESEEERPRTRDRNALVETSTQTIKVPAIGTPDEPPTPVIGNIFGDLEPTSSERPRNRPLSESNNQATQTFSDVIKQMTAQLREQDAINRFPEALKLMKDQLGNLGTADFSKFNVQGFLDTFAQTAGIQDDTSVDAGVAQPARFTFPSVPLTTPTPLVDPATAKQFGVLVGQFGDLIKNTQFAQNNPRLLAQLNSAKLQLDNGQGLQSDGAGGIDFNALFGTNNAFSQLGQVFGAAGQASGSDFFSNAFSSLATGGGVSGLPDASAAAGQFNQLLGLMTATGGATDFSTLMGSNTPSFGDLFNQAVIQSGIDQFSKTVAGNGLPLINQAPPTVPPTAGGLSIRRGGLDTMRLLRA